jgi:hypothetical protein
MSLGKRLPVGRVGESHDIPQAYLFLKQENNVIQEFIVLHPPTGQFGYLCHSYKELVRSLSKQIFDTCQGFASSLVKTWPKHSDVGVPRVNRTRAKTRWHSSTRIGWPV